MPGSGRGAGPDSGKIINLTSLVGGKGIPNGDNIAIHIIYFSLIHLDNIALRTLITTVFPNGISMFPYMHPSHQVIRTRDRRDVTHVDVAGAINL